MVKEEKLKQVEELKEKIDEYSVIGLIDMNKLPSKQMQEIKKQVRGTAEIKMVKKSVMTRAIQGAKKENVKEIEKHVPTQPAILFTNTEPFKFYSIIDKLKSPTFAKEGDISPEEIFIAAGPTSLMPGPVISEFAKVKIPAGVEEGKIAIKRDTVVAKQGDVISKDLANILRKLKIEPIKIGMNVVALFDKGQIYTKDVLSLVGEVYINKTKQAFTEALNLSVSIAYPTKQNIKQLLAKAYQQAKAIESNIGGK